MQSSASAINPRAIQATPNVLCHSQTGPYSSFFYPFLGAVLLSTVLLISMTTICCCVLCAPCNTISVHAKKKDKGEAIFDRPTEVEPPLGDPPGNVYDSASIVPGSGPAIPGMVETEQGTEDSSPAVESIYTPVIPKV